MTPVDEPEYAEPDDQEAGADLDLALPMDESDQQGERKDHTTFNVIDQNGEPFEEHQHAGLGGVILGGTVGSVDSNVIAFNVFSRNLQNGVIFSVSSAASCSARKTS
jgi:hypothetical protein